MKPLAVLILFSFSFSFSFRAEAQVSYSELQSVVSVFHRVYAPELKGQNATLIINGGAAEESKDPWWSFADRHASYGSYVDSEGMRTHYIFMFGGYARMPGMSAEGVAMTLCHELGHGIGGAPFKDKPEGEPLVSVEGQADYFAARFCIKRILPHISSRTPIRPVDSWVENQCARTFPDPDRRRLCLRVFQVLEVERMYFKTQPGIEEETNYETPDASETDSVELNPYHYPSPQCRLDTMVAGALEKPPPRCWWRP